MGVFNPDGSINSGTSKGGGAVKGGSGIDWNAAGSKYAATYNEQHAAAPVVKRPAPAPNFWQRLAGSAGNFAAGVNETMLGGVTRGVVKTANEVLTGFNALEAEKRTADFLHSIGQTNKKGQFEAANVDPNSKAYQTGRDTAGIVEPIVNIPKDIAVGARNVVRQATIGTKNQNVTPDFIKNQTDFLNSQVKAGKIGRQQADQKVADLNAKGKRQAQNISKAEERAGTKYDQSGGALDLLNTVGAFVGGGEAKPIADKLGNIVKVVSPKTGETLGKPVGGAIKDVVKSVGKSKDNAPVDAAGQTAKNAGAKTFTLDDLKTTATPSDHLTTLKQKALTYKSADDFVKSHGEPVYHGTKADFQEFDPAKQNFSGWLSKGFYFTKNLDEAKGYGNNIKERYLTLEKPLKLEQDKINPDRTVTHAKSTQEQIHEKYPETRNMKMGEVADYLQKKGYDGIDNGVNISAFDVNKIKTKQQLTDLYHQAHAEAKSKTMAESTGNPSIIHHSLSDTAAHIDRMQVDQAVQNELKAPGAHVPTIEQRLVDRTGMSRDEASARVRDVADAGRLDISDGHPTKMDKESQTPLDTLAGGPNTTAATLQDLHTATDKLDAQSVQGLKGRDNAVIVKETPNQRLMAYHDGNGKARTFTMYKQPDNTWSKPYYNPAPIKHSDDVNNSMRLLDDAQINKEVERATKDGNTRQYIWTTDPENGATKTLIDGKKDPMTPRAMAYDPEKHYIAGGFVRNKADDQVLGNYVAVGPNGVDVQIGRHFITHDLDFSKMNDGKGGIKRIGHSEGGNNSFNQTERWIEAVTKDAQTQAKLRNLLVYPTRDAEAAMKVEAKAMGDGINKWQRAFKDVPRNRGSVKEMMRDSVYTIEPSKAKIRELGRDGAKKEAEQAFRHAYGDKAADLLKQYRPWLREAYNNMLERLNTTRRQFGMDEIPKRKDYLTHAEEVGGNLSQVYQSMKDSIFGDMGDGARRGVLPAKISGLSDMFEPITKYNKFARAREGDRKPLNPFDPLRQYSSVTLHNIHLTAPAARVRSLQQALRSSDEFISDLPKDIKPDEAQSLTARLTGDHSDMVNWLKEHANILSGKTPEWDRKALESTGGRATIKTMRWAQRQAGRANILGNLGSAVNQTLNVPFMIGTTGIKATTRGIVRSLGDARANAAWRASSFMVERSTDASVLASKSALDKALKPLGVPMKLVVHAVDHITWNATYEKALSKNLTDEAARRAADTSASKIMAGRSIGDTAHVYNNTLMNGPLQFTRESTENWKNLTKDMSPYGKALALASVFVLNAGIKGATGRAPLPDPIAATANTVGDVMQPDDGTADTSVGAKAGRAAQRGAETVTNTVPILSAISNTLPSSTRQLLFGKTSDLGKYDGTMAMTNVATNGTMAVNDLLKGNGTKAAQDTVAMLPGGSQWRKTWQGAETMSNGYTSDSTGKVKTPIDQNDAMNWVKSLLFGKNAVTGRPNAPTSNIKSGAIPENTKIDNKSFIDSLVVYSKAMGADPETAFNRIFSGQTIKRVDNGTIIVQRMPLKDSQAAKKKGKGNNPTMKLDHTVPLEIGGSNDPGNLQLVTTSQWNSYTPVENALGKALRAGKISKDEAQSLIKRFKGKQISAATILSQYPK